MEPNRLIHTESQQGKVEYAGLTKFPRPDAYEDDAPAKLTTKRTEFYRTMGNLFPEGLAYYPGSGADPIPYQGFGERVVYGSLRESEYFSMLKDPNAPKPGIYRESILQTENLDRLRATYADIYRAPFPDNTFKVIAINGAPVKFDKKLVEELSRLLIDDGVIIIEDDQDLNDLNENANVLEKFGFTPHEMDKSGGTTSVMYMGFPEKGGINAYQNGEKLMTDISKKTFVNHLEKGKKVSMSGHLFRVFQKPRSIPVSEAK